MCLSNRPRLLFSVVFSIVINFSNQNLICHLKIKSFLRSQRRVSVPINSTSSPFYGQTAQNSLYGIRVRVRAFLVRKMNPFISNSSCWNCRCRYQSDVIHRSIDSTLQKLESALITQALSQDKELHFQSLCLEIKLVLLKADFKTTFRNVFNC